MQQFVLVNIMVLFGAFMYSSAIKAQCITKHPYSAIFLNYTEGMWLPADSTQPSRNETLWLYTNNHFVYQYFSRSDKPLGIEGEWFVVADTIFLRSELWGATFSNQRNWRWERCLLYPVIK